MKQSKRLLSLLLALAMVFSVIPMSIAAEETETATPETPEAAEEYVLFEDTFDTDAGLADWARTKANLSVADGKLTLTNAGSDAGRILYKPGYDWTEYEVNLTVDATPTWTDIFFLANADFTDYYYLRLYNYERTGITVEIRDDANTSIVTGKATAGVQMVDVKISVADGKANIYLLGSEDAWHTITLDEGYKGTVGMRLVNQTGGGNSTAIEGIKVTDLRDRANVTFNVDGKETVQSVALGDVPAYEGAASFDADGYACTITGWDKEIAAVTGDVTYTAVFEPVLNSYTVTWVNEDGTELDSQTVEYGSTPAYAGETPTKEETDRATYTFAGWTPEVSAVTGDVTYTATFTENIKTYTVIWDVDGIETEETYAYDEMPTFKGSTDKAEDEDYTYEFAGWSPAVVAVTEDAVYAAEFTATEKIKSYTVTWSVNGVETTETYAPGEVPSFKGSTVKASDEKNYYTFTGWDKALAEVDGDVTYTAQYATTKLINFLGATVVMGNNLDMKFAISPSAVANAGGVSVVIKRSFGDGRADEITTIPVSELPTQSGVYAVVYSGLAAKQMCDIVTLTVVNADGQPVSQPWIDSMRDYAMRTYAKASTTDLQKTLFVDMLNYGAAAQSFFGYNVEDLANSLLTDEQKAMASEAKDFNAGFEFDKTKWLGSRLVIESNISFQMAFKNGAGKKATVEFTDNRGNEKKYEYVLDDIGGLYINELVLADARQAMTVTVYNADGSVYYTCNESIEDYLARAATVTDLQRMIMKYSDTAREYLATLG